MLNMILIAILTYTLKGNNSTTVVYTESIYFYFEKVSLHVFTCERGLDNTIYNRNHSRLAFPSWRQCIFLHSINTITSVPVDTFVLTVLLVCNNIMQYNV
jgi:hypothetical protein